MFTKQVPTDQLAHSQKLIAHIQNTLKQKEGWIGFDEYMALTLYTPNLGYYAGGLTKFGQAGDFITAPEMGDLFGCCLAGQISEAFNIVDKQAVLEFGAGSGVLAATILNELDALEHLPETYLILELSGELRIRQQQTIKQNAPKHYSRVKWIDQLPQDFIGVVIANEVLDAMPVKIFEQDEAGAVFEIGVVENHDKNNQDAFCWQAKQADENVINAVSAINLQPVTGKYRSELNFQAQAWVESLGQVIKQGVVILLDYGFPEVEFFHPDRNQGTLMCHFRHHAHDNPFYLPGLQDITAHVDFSAIARSAKKAEFDLIGFAPQGSFLLSAGLLDKIALDASVQAQIELAQQVKKLTMPHEMGELFKVMALSKGLNNEQQCTLSGFSQHNKIDRIFSRPMYNSSAK